MEAPNKDSTEPVGGGAPLLSLVIPVYNEEEGLPEFLRRCRAALSALPLRHELVFVNDGSSDGSYDLLRAEQAGAADLTIVNLSRNFGKEIAMTAGIDHAAGDAVVVIDADLQHPPELIPTLVEKWREGYDVVYATRSDRRDETWLKKTTAQLFYNLMARVGPVTLPANTGDFRLMNRKAVDALRTLRERHRFMKGLFAWIGYRQVSVPYRTDARFAGSSKWSFWRLFELSLEGITSFTVAPLRISMFLGVITALVAFAFGIWTVLKTLLFGEPVRGYPTVMVTILFLSGVQLIALGVIGEYLGRIFNETKQRPLYLLQSVDRGPRSEDASVTDDAGTTGS